MKAAVSLVGVALIAGGLLGGTRWLTAERIVANQAAYAQRQIAAVLGPDGAGAATLCRTTARGYAGTIQLAIGYTASGAIRGVRVLQHTETPGIGDFIDAARSPWIEGFVGRTPSGAANATYQRWQGEVAAVSGATVTRRAVLRAVAAGCTP